jgi:hypothetical protein
MRPWEAASREVDTSKDIRRDQPLRMLPRCQSIEQQRCSGEQNEQGCCVFLR